MLKMTFDLEFQGVTYTVTGNYWPPEPGRWKVFPPEGSQFEVCHVSCQKPGPVLPHFFEGEFPRAAWDRADEEYKERYEK